jgi:hypothetical protein
VFSVVMKAFHLRHLPNNLEGANSPVSMFDHTTGGLVTLLPSHLLALNAKSQVDVFLLSSLLPNDLQSSKDAEGTHGT